MVDQNPAEAKVMRAIVAREARRAAAERRLAQATREKPEPSRVGWSADPVPATRRSATDRAIAERGQANHEKWALRHPERAAAERALARGRAAMLDRWSHKHDGTPETHERHAARREGALARLHASGTIDDDQLAAAHMIGQIAARIGADVAVRTASLETRIDGGTRGGAFFEALGAVRAEMAYSRWRDGLGGHAAAVLAIVVDDVGIARAAADAGMHPRRLRRLLIEALDDWWARNADARRLIDQRALDAAHAGLE